MKPLFYQTLLFRVFMALALILILLLLSNARQDYLHKMNKKLELEVAEKTKHIQESMVNLEETKNQLKDETIQQKKLIGTIGHDIATPLNYIGIVAKKLADLSDEDMIRNRKLITSLQHSAEELYTFTNALKEYADIYNQNSQNPAESVNLHNIIEEKISLFKEIAAGKSITFENDISKNLSIFTNRNVLKVIVHNIVDNAVKYTETGKIVFKYTENEEAYFINIEDTGIGMPIDLMEYYHNLQSTENGNKLKLQKFGIGLHMVIQLLVLIKGNIRFENTTNKGTLVTLQIFK